jgi:hypothetical protein
VRILLHPDDDHVVGRDRGLDLLDDVAVAVGDRGANGRVDLVFREDVSGHRVSL